jgi:hypothetical protein
MWTKILNLENCLFPERNHLAPRKNSTKKTFTIYVLDFLYLLTLDYFLAIILLTKKRSFTDGSK